MKIGYSEKVMELFKNPKNVGALEDANVTAIAGSIACGDMLKLYLKIDPETEKIEDVSFESYGCVANIATSSMITEMVKGKDVDYARKLTFQDEVRELGGLPKIKYHCAVLAIQALRTAIRKWEYLQGKVGLDDKFVKELLRGILDPATDKDLINAGVVRDIKISGKNLKIRVNIGNEEHRDEIISNIEEAFEKMGVNIEIEEG